MSTDYTTSRYRVLKSTLLTGLGATDVHDFQWQGSGPEGFWVVEHTPTETPGAPIPQVTREDRHFTQHMFIDFKHQFFPNVSLSKFAHLSVEMNSTNVWFDLRLDGS